MNTAKYTDNYNDIAKFLHWVMALLIITNYLLGLTLDDTSWYTLHKQIGVTILLLVGLRIVWRLTSKYPKRLAAISPGEDLAAKGGQLMLYFLMISIPLSGILMVEAFGYPVSFWGLFNLPVFIAQQAPDAIHQKKEWHEWLAHAIIILAAGHAVIALYHHYISKNRLLRRMLPNSCNRNEK